MARPPFMAGTLPLYLAGVAAASHVGGTIDVPLAALGLGLVWSVQLATHYNNEYRDLETDRETAAPTRISGGSRVLVRDIVPPRTAIAAARAALGVSIGLGVVVNSVSAWHPLVTGITWAAIVGGWYYSAPPIALSRRGLGELTVAVVTGVFVPGIAYFLQVGAVRTPIVLVWLVSTPLAFATAVGTALPDVDPDRRTGKLTLPARIGVRRAVLSELCVVSAAWLGFVYATWSLQPHRWVVAVAGSIPAMGLVVVPARGATGGSRRPIVAMGLGTMVMLGYGCAVLAWFLIT